mmetsp:Transcript_9682/g.27917  ORF Transcript_9682/g.27917 Transcript_9682/m.27917 type:complete len:284 (-) Transcript_9682:1431-2282(-)
MYLIDLSARFCASHWTPSTGCASPATHGDLINCCNARIAPRQSASSNESDLPSYKDPNKVAIPTRVFCGDTDGGSVAFSVATCNAFMAFFHRGLGIPFVVDSSCSNKSDKKLFNAAVPSSSQSDKTESTKNEHSSSKFLSKFSTVMSNGNAFFNMFPYIDACMLTKEKFHSIFNPSGSFIDAVLATFRHLSIAGNTTFCAQSFSSFLLNNEALETNNVAKVCTAQSLTSNRISSNRSHKWKNTGEIEKSARPFFVSKFSLTPFLEGVIFVDDHDGTSAAFSGR